MGYKLMWCIDIKGYNTVDIHGRVYTNSKEEAISRLKEIASEDLKKLKEKYFSHDWGIWINKTGMYGRVDGESGCADDWDQEIGVTYRVCRKKIPA